MARFRWQSFRASEKAIFDAPEPRASQLAPQVLAGINPDTITEWRKDPEFSGAVKKATAERLLLASGAHRDGEQGWQGPAWALERIYPHRFAGPEVMNQIAVVQGGKVSERVIALRPTD